MAWSSRKTSFSPSLTKNAFTSHLVSDAKLSRSRTSLFSGIPKNLCHRLPTCAARHDPRTHPRATALGTFRFQVMQAPKDPHPLGSHQVKVQTFWDLHPPTLTTPRRPLSLPVLPRVGVPAKVAGQPRPHFQHAPRRVNAFRQGQVPSTSDCLFNQTTMPVLTNLTPPIWLGHPSVC